MLHMSSHYTWGFVTTWHDYGGVLGWPLDTFFWDLTISLSQLLARVWSGPNSLIFFLLSKNKITEGQQANAKIIKNQEEEKMRPLREETGLLGRETPPHNSFIVCNCNCWLVHQSIIVYMLWYFCFRRRSMVGGGRNLTFVDKEIWGFCLDSSM